MLVRVVYSGRCSVFVRLCSVQAVYSLILVSRQGGPLLAADLPYSMHEHCDSHALMLSVNWLRLANALGLKVVKLRGYLTRRVDGEADGKVHQEVVCVSLRDEVRDGNTSVDQRCLICVYVTGTSPTSDQSVLCTTLYADPTQLPGGRGKMAVNGTTRIDGGVEDQEDLAAECDRLP